MVVEESDDPMDDVQSDDPMDVGESADRVDVAVQNAVKCPFLAEDEADELGDVTRAGTLPFLERFADSPRPVLPERQRRSSHRRSRISPARIPSKGDGEGAEARMAKGGHIVFEGSYINFQGVVALLSENSFLWVSLFAAQKLSKLALLQDLAII